MADNPASNAWARVLKILRGASGEPSRLWLAAAAVVLVILGLHSCTTIEAGQVAVRVNNITGSMEVITQPGMIMRLPFGIQDVYLLDVSPQTFHLRGEKNKSKTEVRELDVRAEDGANFTFNDTTLLFHAIPNDAAETVRDSGFGDAYYEWMLPCTRSILRDEFGKLTSVEASDPTKFSAAETSAKQRLNEFLKKHGVEVTSIVTPRPRFSKDYEDLIEARNQAQNQQTVIDSELSRAETERARKLAEVERDQNKVIKEQRAELESQLATASTQQTQTHREVDAYKIDKVANGEAAHAASKGKADELKGQLAAQYQSKQAQIDAFRNQPVERVMERLGERLKGVTIDIQPFSHDGTPKRIQLENVGGAK
jgi:membrane protease subunit HflC